jgi:hypothetical protein
MPATRECVDKSVPPHLVIAYSARTKIDHQSIQAWVHEMSASGLSSRTVRWVHSVLKMTLDFAIDEGQLLSRNPPRNSFRSEVLPSKKPSELGFWGWSRLVSNQRPSACEADALPLSYETREHRSVIDGRRRLTRRAARPRISRTQRAITPAVSSRHDASTASSCSPSPRMRWPVAAVRALRPLRHRRRRHPRLRRRRALRRQPALLPPKRLSPKRLPNSSASPLLAATWAACSDPHMSGATYPNVSGSRLRSLRTTSSTTGRASTCRLARVPRSTAWATPRWVPTRRWCTASRSPRAI